MKLLKNDNDVNVSFAQVLLNNLTGSVPMVLEEDDEHIEAYSAEVKIVFVTLACVSVLSSVVAITLMHRAKKIPYASKILSVGLLCFDVMVMLTSTIQKFITDTTVFITVQTFLILFLQLTQITVFIMTIERYLLIVKPMRYTSLVTKTVIRNTVLLIWFCYTSLSLFFRYGLCFLRYRTDLVFTKPAFCFKLTTVLNGPLIAIALLTACVCYVQIFKCVRSKVSPGRVLTMTETARTIQSYRSTSLVFVYLVIVVSTFLAFAVVLLLVYLEILPATSFLQRITFEAVFTLSRMFDPFLYVFWFKECRYQLLTFLSLFIKRYRPKAERMRIEVYDIVTREVPLRPLAETRDI